MSDTVKITSKSNQVNATLPANDSGVVFDGKGYPDLIVQLGETKTIGTGEILTRDSATVDGDLIIDGKLQIKE